LPHFPAVTAEKNNARKRNEKILRTFIQRFLYPKGVNHLIPPQGKLDKKKNIH